MQRPGRARTPRASASASTGRVSTATALGVPDAMVEIWQANQLRALQSPRRHGATCRSTPALPASGAPAPTTTAPSGSRRSSRGAVPFDAAQMQAPHICVTVFARGLLNHLLTRLYFADEPANAADPVLRCVPAERRGTLLAQPRRSEAGMLPLRYRAAGRGRNRVLQSVSGVAPMTDFLSLPDAIATYVQDGRTVALEGFTHLIPFAAGHEIIRQGKRDLTLIRMTPDLIYDQMIGMGCARKLVFSWGGNPGVGSLHRLRDAVEHGWPGPLEIEEHSHAAMAAAYAAGAAGLPCAILRAYLGTDLAGHQPEHPLHHLPVHRRTAGRRARDPARPGDHPRAAGRPGRATC